MTECNCGKGKSEEKTLNLVVKGMSCSHCQRAVEGAVRKLVGVKEAGVDLEQGILTVTYDPGRISLAEIQEAVVDAGYEAKLSGNRPGA